MVTENMKLLPNINVNNLANLLTAENVKQSMPNRGLGRKLYIPIEARKENILIEFFSETTVSEIPENPERGYDIDDLTIFSGVTIYNLPKLTKEPLVGDAFQSIDGFVMTLDDFFENYAHDISGTTSAQLHRIMEDMKPSDSDIEVIINSANEPWSERDPATKEIYKVVYH
jgi:hypothetical protein